SLGPRVVRLPHRVPPAADARDGEGRRVVVRPHVDPARVAGYVVDPVGRVATEFRDDEVIERTSVTWTTRGGHRDWGGGATTQPAEGGGLPGRHGSARPDRPVPARGGRPGAERAIPGSRSADSPPRRRGPRTPRCPRRRWKTTPG